jgi:hypothetical protein
MNRIKNGLGISKQLFDVKLIRMCNILHITLYELKKREEVFTALHSNREW